MLPLPKSKRLVLEYLTPDDSPFIFKLQSGSSWSQYIEAMPDRTLADAESYIRSGPMASYAQYYYGLYKVVFKEFAEPVGICGLVKRDFLTAPDLGFAFLQEYQGRGFAFESAQAVIAHAKTMRIPELQAITTPENVRSAKLLLKLDFTPDAEILHARDKTFHLYRKAL